MPIAIDGSGTITGISAGGLPDSSITAAELASGAVTQVKLASGVAGSGPAFGAYRSTNQSISATTYTKIQFDTEEFDTASCFDNATNYRFTPNVAGYYQINAVWQIDGVAGAAGQVLVTIYKNGSVFKFGMYGSATSSSSSNSVVSSLVYCNGTTDYIEIYAYVGNADVILAGQTYTYVNGYLARSA